MQPFLEDTAWEASWLGQREFLFWWLLVLGFVVVVCLFFFLVNQNMQILSSYSVGLIREMCRLKNGVRKVKRKYLFIMSPEENNQILR